MGGWRGRTCVRELLYPGQVWRNVEMGPEKHRLAPSPRATPLLVFEILSPLGTPYTRSHSLSSCLDALP